MCQYDNEPYFERKEFKDKYMSLEESESTFHFAEKDNQEYLDKQIKQKEKEKRRMKLGITMPTPSGSAPRTAGEKALIMLEEEKEDTQEEVKGDEVSKLALELPISIE